MKDILQKINKTYTAIIVVIVLFIFYVGGAIYYYRFAKPFVAPTSQNINGIAYTNTLREITEEMVDHWPVNDIIFWPSNLLDNPQNFRLGQLEALRYATRLLRANLSRLRAEDPINPNVDNAYNSFAIDPDALILPSAEHKYGEGLQALTQYAEDLANNRAEFFARVDTLREVIEEFTILLDATGQRLRAVSSESDPSTTNTNKDSMSAESHAGGDADSLSLRQADDAFYYARGISYVLSHLLTAIQSDFTSVIEKRHADTLFRALIADLEACQFEPWVVIAAAQDSMFANHLLNMQAHIINARLKLRAISNVLGGTTIAN